MKTNYYGVIATSAMSNIGKYLDEIYTSKTEAEKRAEELNKDTNYKADASVIRGLKNISNIAGISIEKLKERA